MKRSDVHILLGSLFFGTLVWLSVTLREQYQTSVQVPLVINNIPEGWAIKTPVPPQMNLRFRGDGWRLALLLLSRDLRLRIPLYTIPSGLRFSDSNDPWRTRVITAGDVADRLALRGNVRLVDVKPDSVFIALDRFTQKTVPVILDYAASFHDGYGQTGAPSLLPDSITIGGAVSVLRAITAWHTARATFDNLKNPLDQEVPLAPAEKYELSFSTASVRVRINVQPFAEKLFAGLPVTADSVPDDREVIFIPPKIDVVARAGIRQLSNLAEMDFRVFVPYASVVADSTGSIDVSVTPPPGVQLVSKRPDRLQYIVRKRLYETLH